MASIRSVMAAKMSIREFLRLFPSAAFWTCTFVLAHRSDELYKPWHCLLKEIRRAFPDFCGLRVFQLHPGGHLWHIHFLANVWLPFEGMWAVSHRYGFGSLRVVRVTGIDETVEYLCRDMVKRRHGRDKGMRLWGKMGKWSHELVKDVHSDSSLHLAIARYRELSGKAGKIRFLDFAKIRRNWLVWGDYDAFPHHVHVELCAVPPRREKSTKVSNYEAKA